MMIDSSGCRNELLEFFMIRVSVRLSERSLHKEEQNKFCQK